MIITKLSVENFRDVSCGSFWTVAFLLHHNISKDIKDGRTGYHQDIITGIQLNQDELISYFGRDGIFKN